MPWHSIAMDLTLAVLKSWRCCSVTAWTSLTNIPKLFLTEALMLSLTKPWGFPHGTDGKESACNIGEPGLIPGSGRSPGGGHGNPLQYFCLENPMDRGVWRATVQRVSKSRTWLKQLHASFIYYILFISTKQLSVYTHTHTQHTNKKYFLSFKAIIIITLVVG